MYEQEISLGQSSILLILEPKGRGLTAQGNGIIGFGLTEAQAIADWKDQMLSYCLDNI
jgi:hypothetical protein